MSAITPSEEETAALALLAELQLSPSTQPQSVFAALKRIKHELIGHDQKKELFVRLGVVPPLVRILAERRGGLDEQQWSDLRVEAGIAVGSLAYGGEPYIYQLFNSNALPPLIASLNASSSPKLILSSLRTLNTILDTYTSSVSSTPNPSFTISSALYTPEVLRDLHKILAQESSSTLVQQQISLTANLIAKSCGRYPPSSIDGGGSLQDGEGAHQRLLVEAGVLEALSARLSSFVFTGNTVKHCRNIKDNLIPPPSAKLAPILDALSAIIKDSKLRSLDFLFSPPISSIFPHFPSSPAPEKRTFSSTKPSETALAGTNKITLPQPKVSTSLIQPPQLLITPSSFPPLSAASATSSSSTHFRDMFPLSPPSPFTFNPATNSSQYHYHPHHSLHHLGLHHIHTGSIEAQSGSNGSRAVTESDSESSGASPLRHHYPDTVESEDAILHSTTLPSSHSEAASTPETEMEIEQSRLVLWLITKVRGGDSVTRLMAIGLLTNIFRVGLIRKKLVLLLVLLVLPVLVRLLDNLDDPKESGGRVASAGSGGVIDAEMRKRWTISERAPAVLAQLVMDSVDMQKAAVDAGAIKKLANLLKKSAESFPSSSNTTNGGQNAKSLPTPEGTNGVGSPAWQHCMRVKEGTLRCLASLALFKDEYRKAIIDAGVVPILVSSMKPINLVSPNDGGSPSPVLIAACGLIRALSRSVSILRTSLIDAGVATPLLALLTNDDIEVRNASTAAVCNLVLEFSPMRGPILEAGVLEILCGHAKSSHAGLRLNALWALKHLVLEADIDVKKKCFEGLGGRWLIGVIRRDVESIGKDDEDEPMAETPADDDDNEMENTRRHDEFYDAPEPPNPRTSTLPPKAARLYAALEIAENDSASRIKKQETALQEQGLDFLRNLICGKGCHMMIKTLFSAFSSATLFSVLSSLLSPSSNQPPGEVVNAVVYILIHLAAGSPDQKTLLIEQTPLLKKLCQYWNHRLPHVRTGLAWIVINLTWREDGEEDEAVRERARVLRELGFAEILQKMKADAELDVRERVKTACYQMGE